ncbi:hypothetical protein BD408DRAFT_109033 [Parasitella parasitica]|nr:hypothetical protein BD408DRAFT_109033 [Parasitella parasitica]
MWEDAIQAFKKDLKYWSYRIPPGYNTKYKFPLEFTAPIIAPHLVEEETVSAPLPPKKDDPAPQYLRVPDEIAMSPYIYDSDIEDTNERESIVEGESSLDMHENVNETSAKQQHTQGPEYDRTNQPIKNRSNRSHIPRIITMHVDQDPNSSELSKNPFTPPQSAAAGVDSLTPSSALYSINTNPFESNAEPEQSPVKTPKSTNPFDSKNQQPQQQSSTNPFEYDEPQLEDDKGIRSVHSQKSTKQKHKHHSWISTTTHHLGATLSHHSSTKSTSEGEDEDEDDCKTPVAKKNHKFNPFKRVLSRNGAKDGKKQCISSSSSEETALDDTIIMLQRKNSSRRNAIQGPY